MKILLVCIAALLFAIGWLAGLVAVAVIWCWSALAVGWNEARRLGRRSEVGAAPDRRPLRAV